LSALLEFLGLVPRALLLDGDVYWDAKARPRALYHGVLLLLFLGVALGLARAAGALVTRVASPHPADLAWAAEHGLSRLPAVQRLGASGGAWLVPLLKGLVAGPQPPSSSLLGAPAGLFLGWLTFGLLAHAAARLLGGRGRLADTLACTAVAEAPRTILLVPFLPSLGLAAVGVEAWVLAARFQAIRTAHGLDGWRSFWAASGAALLLGMLALGLWAQGVG